MRQSLAPGSKCLKVDITSFFSTFHVITWHSGPASGNVHTSSHKIFFSFLCQWKFTHVSADMQATQLVFKRKPATWVHQSWSSYDVIRETREGWTLLTVETKVNGDSKSTNERGPSLVRLVQKSFPQRTLQAGQAVLLGRLYLSMCLWVWSCDNLYFWKPWLVHQRLYTRIHPPSHPDDWKKSQG